jgi:anti-sigma B factor antagonist
MLPDHKELSLTVESMPGTSIVRCHGRLTITSASVLRYEVKRLLPQTRDIVIDLTDLTMMDSVGLGTIAGLYASARNAGCELHMVNLAPRIRELFSVTRLLSLFEPGTNIRIP